MLIRIEYYIHTCLIPITPVTLMLQTSSSEKVKSVMSIFNKSQSGEFDDLMTVR